MYQSKANKYDRSGPWNSSQKNIFFVLTRYVETFHHSKLTKSKFYDRLSTKSKVLGGGENLVAF